MMNLIAKCVLAAAIGAAAVSATTPIFAADAKKAAPPPAACTLHTHSYKCANGLCAVSWCGHDGKWYPTPFFCWEPFCAHKK